jgi:crossover junction endodeoxyribonuclease RuvC
MTQATLIAIDPGAVSGAMAWFYDDGKIVVADMPVVDKQVDAAEFSYLLRTTSAKASVVERVASMPKQGVASTFKFGMAVGLIHGVLLARGVPVNLVTPGVWKKHFNLGPDKEQARGLAKRLYPGIQGMERKKDAGRAEALLLGRYWMEKHP